MCLSQEKPTNILICGSPLLSKDPQSSCSITLGWGDARRAKRQGHSLPASCGSQGFVPFPLCDKQPDVSGHIMLVLSIEQQPSGAVGTSEAARNVPEQTICKTCFIGMFPPRSDYQISFCHISKCIGLSYKTQHLWVCSQMSK